MTSIVLSFVGNQDPGTDKNDKEGSIVSLTNHLLEQNQEIERIILLYTDGTQEAANFTKEWLLSGEVQPLKIIEENIELIPVNEKLSQDPIDLLLAIQAARQALEKAKSYLRSGDRLELNASSGTPAMKSAWSILQAAGYAPQSRVWQVRNPDKMIPGQSRVFEANVDTLKREFDLKVIQQQINNYNYSGALANFKESGLKDNGVSVLLEYGHCRLACDFKKARQAIDRFRKIIDPRLSEEIDRLASHDQRYFIVELYFHALTKLKNQEYSNFLVLLFAFQESVLRFQVRKRLCPELLNYPWKDVKEQVEKAIQQYQEGQLHSYLHRLPNGRLLQLNHPSRPVLLAILEYVSEQQSLLEPLKRLNKYCNQRNDYVHQFEGVSFIEDEEHLVRDLHKIVRQITQIPEQNSFDILNQQLHSLLTRLSLAK
ncbi:hypothetical protein NIES593_03985 [Hydrococcus rivularis NIES-593]|uniref:CRISPR-associated protein n=1 Tax=Hydrococcus rivularis NIES-593 TaxID=1921803 RepID=A0A1U7HPJ1_9CYAN|nr:hypothetical protein [Hydrococcus rivularis]OKH25513.1 hypothetical protein NIES593_03985 [Hydrococcus rivularis NIES-593]